VGLVAYARPVKTASGARAAPSAYRGRSGHGILRFETSAVRLVWTWGQAMGSVAPIVRSAGVMVALVGVLTACDSKPDHRLGDQVDVRVQARSITGGQSTRGMVGLTVLEVRRGDPAGLANTSRAGTGTPYEVVSSLTNKTDVALSVSIGLYGIDTAGNRLTDVYSEDIYFRLPGSNCEPYSYSSGPLVQRGAKSRCHLFIVPAGEELDRVGSDADTEWSVK
jgi:hypothetical protein